MPTLADALGGQPVYGFYPHLNPKVANKPDTLNTPEAKGKLAETLLSMAPGSGEAMSLRDAWSASGKGAEALTAGNYGQAASEYGNLATALLASLPGAGVIARGTKRGAEWMNQNLPAGVNKLVDAMMPSDPKNTLNIFAGPTAKTADTAALAKAEEMAASGASRDDIWSQTGWFQGNDGKWRFEIDDSSMGVRIPRGANFDSMSRYSTAIDHPALFDAYPPMARNRIGFDGRTPDSEIDLENFDTTIGLAGRMNSMFGGIRPNKLDQVRSDTAHELQHNIQVREGFPLGTGADELMSDPAFTKGVEAEYARLRASNIDPTATEDDLLNLARNNVGMDLYRRTAGEVEARNVASRLGMSLEQRRAFPPWVTQDVPDAQQIVRAGTNGVAESRSYVSPTPWVGSRHADRYADELHGQTPQIDTSTFWREMQGAEAAARADPAAIAAETARRRGTKAAVRNYLDMFNPDAVLTSYGRRKNFIPEE